MAADHSGHDHTGHDHAHGPANYSRAFALGIGLNLAFVVVEAVYGLRSGSLALVADAGHNLSDVIGLVLAWVAALLARRLPTPTRTYGMRRASVLAAFGNAVLLLLAIGAIAWEAIGRFGNPQPVNSGTVMAVAGVGILINTATALLFLRGRKSDINIRGAYLHMAADAAVSAGVVVAGLAIRLTGWQWVDPAVSLIIVAVIAAGTWGLLRASTDMAMDAVPAGIRPQSVADYLCSLPGVSELHDLHIWSISTTESALTAHLIRPAFTDDDELLLSIYEDLRKRFGIQHATIQIERGHGPHPCVFAPAEVI